MTAPAMRLAAAFALAMLLRPGAASAAPPKDPSCDPHWQALDQARALRAAHQPDGAIAIAEGVLKQSPQDFRATYTVGLAMLDKHDIAGGMKMLSAAADLLHDRYAACGAANGWYSIYNTLGAEYYSQQNYALAESSLNVAFGKFATLNQDTQKKLLNNLGLLYFHNGNLSKSAFYYDKAAQAHAPGAADRLRLVKSIDNPKPQTAPTR
jgi:tetratricopeptide (TPR) repeat protein